MAYLSSKFEPDDIVRLKDGFLPKAKARMWVVLDVLNNGKVLLGRSDKDYTWEASEEDLLRQNEEEGIPHGG